MATFRAYVNLSRIYILLVDGGDKAEAEQNAERMTAHDVEAEGMLALEEKEVLYGETKEAYTEFIPQAVANPINGGDEIPAALGMS